MTGFRTAAIACACVLLAACGGTTKQASIRRSVAMQLASQSDAVAAALRSDPGLRAILESSIYGESVTGAAILESERRVLIGVTGWIRLGLSAASTTALATP